MIRGIILAGGSGKRLWPLSREKKPKQLLKLFQSKTFLEESVERLLPIVDTVSISTGKNLVEEIKEFIPNARLIVEPERRDTAAAIGLCAINFKWDDVLVFTPSDAYITPTKEFQDTIKTAIKFAEDKGGIIVVGIKPTSPSVNFGYLKLGLGNKVEKFCEKPTNEIATKYVASGYFWNAGIFVAKAGVILDLIEKYEPEIYFDLIKIRKGASPEEIYPNIKKISFDYAVMEKAEKVFFVPASFYWNDVGSFNAIGEIVKDKNVVMNGNLLELNSSGNIVSTTDSKKSIALVGCSDLVIIDTPGALLVCPKSMSDLIKKFVEEKVPKELQ